jgi:hypothetical protein
MCRNVKNRPTKRCSRRRTTKEKFLREIFSAIQIMNGVNKNHRYADTILSANTFIVSCVVGVVDFSYNESA